MIKTTDISEMKNMPIITVFIIWGHVEFGGLGLFGAEFKPTNSRPFVKLLTNYCFLFRVARAHNGARGSKILYQNLVT